MRDETPNKEPWTYSFEKAWDAAWTALPLEGWELNSANRALGRFDAKVGMSICVGRELFRKPGKARRSVYKNPNLGKSTTPELRLGKTRQDIDRFIYLLQITLKER